MWKRRPIAKRAHRPARRLIDPELFIDTFYRKISAKDLVSTEELAVILNVERRQVRRYARNRDLRPVIRTIHQGKTLELWDKEEFVRNLYAPRLATMIKWKIQLSELVNLKRKGRMECSEDFQWLMKMTGRQVVQQKITRKAPIPTSSTLQLLEEIISGFLDQIRKSSSPKIKSDPSSSPEHHQINSSASHSEPMTPTTNGSDSTPSTS